LDPLENGEIKRHPIGNHGNKKKSSSGNKLQQECELPRTDANEQKPFKLGEVKSKSSGEPDYEVTKFPVPRT
jgi:hypothetical protein